MNPLTNVKNINKLNEIEADLGTAGGKTSWHEQYKDSAYIFIGGLPYDLTEGDIICVFSQYGEIVNINLVRDKKSGKSKGYCFLAYEDQRSTILAVDNFNGIKLLGRVLRVDHVGQYRKPKEDENDDEFTKRLRQEGCAPKAPSSPVSEDASSEDYQIPTKKVKKEHKHKSKSHDRKKKKKKHKREDRKHSSDSESSQSEEERSVHLLQVKQEVDRGYEGSAKREHKDGQRKDYGQDEFTQWRAGDRQGTEKLGWRGRERDERKERDRERLKHRSYDQQGRHRETDKQKTRRFSRSQSPEEHRDQWEDGDLDRYRDRSREMSRHEDRPKEYKSSHQEQERHPPPGKSFRSLDRDRSPDSSRNRYRDSDRDYKDQSDRCSYKNWHQEQEHSRFSDKSEGRGRNRDCYGKRDR